MGLKRDSNNRPVAGAVTDDANKTVVPLKVDAVSGRLLLQVDKSSGGAPTVANQPASRDGNNEPVSLVKGSDSNVYPLHIDATSGHLSIDVTFE